MAMTEPRLILSTISQINHQEQERIQSSYRMFQQGCGQISKKPGKVFSLRGFGMTHSGAHLQGKRPQKPPSSCNNI
jgi:hypothetical protein